MDRTQKDVELKMKYLTKEESIYKNETLNRYKLGKHLSLIQKCKVIMNELFDIAVRHKNDWKALEQLKIYEMILHTNVDTNNYVNQMLEIQIHYLNDTAGEYVDDVDDKGQDVTDKGDNVDDKGDNVVDKGGNVTDKSDNVDDKGDNVTEKGDNVDELKEQKRN